jgi:alanyl-tRNA synthetase
MESEGKVLRIWRAGEDGSSASAGETVDVVLDRTPFYAEAGGQVGDTGWLEADDVRAEVLDTTCPLEGVVVHRVRVERGELRRGSVVRASVDAPRRAAIARAHTATHLLHWALRQRLGPHATQAGSLVAPDRLRFDLSHLQALSATERADITELVNQRILEDKPVTWTVVSREAAREAGAMALFGEKYGEEVRMVAMGDFSKELCGGTHLDRTAAIGAFLITSEGSIGAGLRRIEAVTGMAAVRLAEQRGGLLSQASEALRCPPEEAPDKIAAALAEIKRLGKELNAARSRGAGELARELAGRAEAVDGIPVLAASVPDQTADALRALADRLLEMLGSGVVVLGTVADDKVLFVSEVSPDLAGKVVHAGNLLREVAKVAGGGGGGRPNFAQAGGQDPSKLEEALARVRELVRSQRADRE